jgi:hypothetical protein
VAQEDVIASGKVACCGYTGTSMQELNTNLAKILLPPTMPLHIVQQPPTTTTTTTTITTHTETHMSNIGPNNKSTNRPVHSKQFSSSKKMWVWPVIGPPEQNSWSRGPG